LVPACERGKRSPDVPSGTTRENPGASERIVDLETVPQEFAWQNFEPLAAFIKKKVENIFRNLFLGKKF
jgi:hypothetical protein